jgi:hypothetical protein
VPIILPSTVEQQGERPHATQPWVWLLQLQVSKGDIATPSVLLRSSSLDVPLEWPASNPTVQTWYPWPFTFSPIEQNQEGDLPQVQLSIDNSTRFLMPYLHNGKIEGNQAVLMLVPTAALAIPYPDHEFLHWDLRVGGVQATSSAITLRLERPNFFARTSPTDRYIPKRCRWSFGSHQCGYVQNAFAAFTSCDKSLAACIERGDDMTLRGLPPVLPGNYGGHPGIASRRR